MPKFLSHIDLSDLELKNAKLHQWATGGRPSTAQARIGYNTTFDCPEWNNGSNWSRILRESDIDYSGASSTATGSGTTGDVLTDSTFAYIYGQAWGSGEGDDQMARIIYDSASNKTGDFNVIPGLFEGYLNGVAARSLGFADDHPLLVSITGKATASAVSMTDTAADPTYALNVTALSVAASDITLASGYLLEGNGSNVAAAVTKASIALSAWGAAAANVAMGANRITGLGDPVDAQDAVTKTYLDTALSLGNAPKTAVRFTTTTALPAYTYAAGPPRRITANASGAFPTTDGITPIVGDRVLVRHESGSGEKYNGTWEFIAVGDGSNPWVLERGDEEDSDAEVVTGIAYFVTSGTTYAGTEWTLATTGTITLDSTSLRFVQTGGSVAYTAGNGMVLSGTVFHFAQAGSYTANTIPYASGSASIGFISAGSAYQPLRVPSGGGAPAFGAIDISQSAAVTGTLAVGNGGTGLASYTTGDLLYASGSGALSKLAGVATGNALISGGVGTAPSFGKIGLTTHISGTLAVANGGTGATTFTANAILVGNGTSAVQTVGTSTSAQILVSQSGGALSFVTPSGSGDVTIAATGTMTIGSNKVTFAKMEQVTGPVFTGRASGSGNQEAMSLATVKGLLGLSATLYQAEVKRETLASGASSYTITNPWNDFDPVVQVWGVDGVQVFPDISRTTTAPWQITIGFGATTAQNYRVVMTGNASA